MSSRFAALALVAGAVVFPSCSSTSTSVTAPTVAKCDVTLGNQPTSMFPATGGSGSLSVATTRDCSWSATADTSWIALSPASGQGEGSVAFTVAANPAPAARSAGITVSGERVTVSQAAAPCHFDLNRTRDGIDAAGGQLSVGVTTLNGCAWSASSAASWIAIRSGQSGNGNGTVVLSVAGNTGAQRSGTVTIAGQPYVVTQDAAAATPAPPSPTPPPTLPPSCSPSLSASAQSFAAAGGATTVNVSVQSGCAWSASSSAEWIAVSGSSGSGDGQVRLSVATNTNVATRTAIVTIAGLPFTVTQEGAAPPPPPPPQTVQVSGSISSLSGHCPSLSFSIGRKAIVTDVSTDFRGISCGELKNKVKVTVNGFEASGAPLHAVSVERQTNDD